MQLSSAELAPTDHHTVLSLSMTRYSTGPSPPANWYTCAPSHRQRWIEVAAVIISTRAIIISGRAARVHAAEDAAVSCVSAISDALSVSP